MAAGGASGADERPQVIITDSPEALEAARRLFPTLGAVYVNSDASELDALTGRKLVLMPTAGQVAAARALADRLVRIAAEVKLCPPEATRAAGWSIAMLAAADVQEWIKAVREEPLKIPAQGAEAATPGQLEQHPPPPGHSAAQSPALEPAGPPNEPPDLGIPPLGAAAPPPGARRRRGKPDLSLVDGNAQRAPDPDDEPLPAELSEDALAEHFATAYGEDWRYCTEWGMWLQWRGDGWHRDRRNEVSDLCKEVTRQALLWPEAAKLTLASRQKLNSKRTAWNARDMAGADRRISILAEQLDADQMLLGVPGGVVDLRTGKLLEAERGQYVTRRCSVAPAEGPHPLFDRVLERAGAGRDGMREYLLRWFGYFLTGSVSEEAFMFLHGPGGSGKSTLIKCLSEIMGDYALTISMDALTETKQQRHSQEIARLEGARLVYASETEEGRRFNEALIKWLTGRDKIVAHRMRMDDHEFMPTFKMLIYGNSVPHLKSVGEEMRRRIHLLEYAGMIAPEERDTTLKDRLIAEYPAILAALVRGCVDWQVSAGLGKPESVSDSVEKYLEGEDSMAAFFDEWVERDVNAKEATGDVYRRYRSWATNAGEYVMSQKRFVQTLRARGFESTRTGTRRYISGMRLRLPDAPEQPPYYDRD